MATTLALLHNNSKRSQGSLDSELNSSEMKAVGGLVACSEELAADQNVTPTRLSNQTPLTKEQKLRDAKQQKRHESSQTAGQGVSEALQKGQRQAQQEYYMLHMDNEADQQNKAHQVQKMSKAQQQQHFQVKMRELNLDLHSVNTSRIQLIKTNSSKQASFSVASQSTFPRNATDLFSAQLSPTSRGVQASSPPLQPKTNLRRLEIQLMQHSPSNRSLAKKDQPRTVNQSTTSLENPNIAEFESPFQKNNLKSKIEYVIGPFQQHINSSAQIVVTKQGGYTRKSNHAAALESAGPSAHYTEFDESKMLNNKASKNEQAFFDDSLPLIETAYANNFPNVVNSNTYADHQASSPDLAVDPPAILSSRVITKQNSQASSTEVILSKYAPKQKGLDSISSTNAARNRKEMQMLYGSGNDAFRPEFTQVPASIFKRQIRNEVRDQETMRPFQRLEAFMNAQSAEQAMKNHPNRRARARQTQQAHSQQHKSEKPRHANSGIDQKGEVKVNENGSQESPQGQSFDRNAGGSTHALQSLIDGSRRTSQVVDESKRNSTISTKNVILSYQATQKNIGLQSCEPSLSISPLGQKIVTFQRMHLPQIDGRPSKRLIGKHTRTKGFYSSAEARNRNLSITESHERQVKLSQDLYASQILKTKQGHVPSMSQLQTYIRTPKGGYRALATPEQHTRRSLPKMPSSLRSTTNQLDQAEDQEDSIYSLTARHSSVNERGLKQSPGRRGYDSALGSMSQRKAKRDMMRLGAGLGNKCSGGWGLKGTDAMRLSRLEKLQELANPESLKKVGDMQADFMYQAESRMESHMREISEKKRKFEKLSKTRNTKGIQALRQKLDQEKAEKEALDRLQIESESREITLGVRSPSGQELRFQPTINVIDSNLQGKL